MKNLLLTAYAMFICISIIQAQKTEGMKGETEGMKSKYQKQEKLLIKVKDGAKPDIYVDGKKFDFAVELLDQDKIESVSVIDDERAIKEYNAPNGVVLIKTKNKINSDKSKITVIAYGATISGKTPVIIIDGKVASKEALEKLSPDDVDKIEILKDGQAIEKYNAPDGVVIITTRKGMKGEK